MSLNKKYIQEIKLTFNTEKIISVKKTWLHLVQYKLSFLCNFLYFDACVVYFNY